MEVVSGMPQRAAILAEVSDQAGPQVYYHYTSLGTLWAILDSDTLRANHARFSNDSEEIKRGERLLKDICESRTKQEDGLTDGQKRLRERLLDYIGKLERDEKSGIDCYIVCFCKSNDKLSQWRGYCRDGGVSIGFELGNQIEYYYRDQPFEVQAMHSRKLCEVWYVSDEKPIKGQVRKGQVRKGQVRGIITQDELKVQVCDMLNDHEGEEIERQKSLLSTMISRIKHSGFYEEEEYRLILQNDLWSSGEAGDHPLDPYIRYRKGDVLSPYLTLSFGKTIDDSTTNVPSAPSITTYNLEKKVELLLKRRFNNNMVQCKKDKKGNATMRVVIGMGTDAQQEECFRKVENVIERAYPGAEKTISIWCEGHLPIRSITVSPCQDQDEVVESIRHYCQHGKYWLKYVQVEGSKIPYRRPK